MSRIRIELDRLKLSLHGVPAQVAEAAIQGLGHELRRHLTGRPLFDTPGIQAAPATPTVPHSGTQLDAPALRRIVAERLIQGIVERGREEPGTNGARG